MKWAKHGVQLAVMVPVAVIAVACASAAASKTVDCTPRHHPPAACKQAHLSPFGYVWVARNPVSRTNPYRGVVEDPPAEHAPPVEHAPAEDPVHVSVGGEK